MSDAFRGEATPTFLTIPFVVAPVFWIVALVLLELGIATGVTLFYYSLMIFAAATVLLCSFVPRSLAVVPLLILIVGPVILQGGFRVLFTGIDFIVVVFIIFQLHARSESKKSQSMMEASKRNIFFTLYLIISIFFVLSSLVTFSFGYLDPAYWAIIMAFGLAGWFYPKGSRYTVPVGISYWIAIFVSDVLVFRQFSPGLASVASATNLAGMYLALLWLSPIRYDGLTNRQITNESTRFSH